MGPRGPSLQTLIRVNGPGAVVCLLLGSFLSWACGSSTGGELFIPAPAAERELEPALRAQVEPLIAKVRRELEQGLEVEAADHLLELAYRYDAGTVYDLARDSYAAVLELDPTRPEALVHLARMSQEFGRPREALGLLGRVQAQGVWGAAVAWRSGLLWLNLDELDQAQEAFGKATALAPEEVSGWIGLARVALQREQFTEAETLLQEALSRNPRDSYACELLSRALAAQGFSSRARAVLAQRGNGTAAWRDPWRAQVFQYSVGFGNRLQWAESLLAGGRLGEALALLEELAGEQPQHTTLASMRGFALMEVGRGAEALAVIDAALDHDPEHFRLHLNRALVLQRRGDSRAALASARRTVELLPGYAAGHALVAELLSDIGAQAAAREALSKARELGAPEHLLGTVGEIIARREGQR